MQATGRHYRQQARYVHTVATYKVATRQGGLKTQHATLHEEAGGRSAPGQAAAAQASTRTACMQPGAGVWQVCGTSTIPHLNSCFQVRYRVAFLQAQHAAPATLQALDEELHDGSVTPGSTVCVTQIFVLKHRCKEATWCVMGNGTRAELATEMFGCSASFDG